MGAKQKKEFSINIIGLNLLSMGILTNELMGTLP